MPVALAASPSASSAAAHRGFAPMHEKCTAAWECDGRTCREGTHWVLTYSLGNYEVLTGYSYEIHWGRWCDSVAGASEVMRARTSVPCGAAAGVRYSQ